VSFSVWADGMLGRVPRKASPNFLCLGMRLGERALIEETSNHSQSRDAAGFAFQFSVSQNSPNFTNENAPPNGGEGTPIPQTGATFSPNSSGGNSFQNGVSGAPPTSSNGNSGRPLPGSGASGIPPPQATITSSVSTGGGGVSNPELLGDLPIIFLLSFSLFAVANILLARSGRLLRSIALVRDDLFPPNKEAIDELRESGSGAIIVFYVIVLAILFFNRALRFGQLYRDGGDLAWSMVYSILLDLDSLSPLLFALAIAPAAVAMINFVMFASISARLRSTPQTPSPIVGFFGAFAALISLLGSLAGISRLFLELTKH